MSEDTKAFDDECYEALERLSRVRAYLKSAVDTPGQRKIFAEKLARNTEHIDHVLDQLNDYRAIQAL